MTEVWFRNPKLWVRELAEVGPGADRVAMDRGFAVKNRIDPVKWAKLYFGEHGNWEVLFVGDQGTAHLDSDHDLTNPRAVYPTWTYGDDEFSLLEEMIQFPVGDDIDLTSGEYAPDIRPVSGQEHRVVLINLPDMRTGGGKQFLRTVRELQEEYPKCKLHVHGLNGWNVAFGMGIGAADIECREPAAGGRIILPNGRLLPWAKAVGSMQWVTLFGMSITDLKVPRNRCIYNIKSALWAGENWDKNIRFKSRENGKASPPDIHSHEVAIPESSGKLMRGAEQPGDKQLCDTCSLNNDCKYYRRGAVCSVPGTESSRLAKFFNTRDSGSIIEGLGRVMEVQAVRVERGLRDEEEFNELNPEVSQGLSTLFNEGVKLAKLVDPSLTKPGVQVNVGPAIQGGGEKAIVAQAVAQLEARGIDRADITANMLEMMVSQLLGIRPEPIQGEIAQ